jgi:hypothetical protein
MSLVLLQVAVGLVSAVGVLLTSSPVLLSVALALGVTAACTAVRTGALAWHRRLTLRAGG